MRASHRHVPAYIVTKVLAAIVAAAVLWVVASGVDGCSASESGFATNGYGDHSPGGYSLLAVLGGDAGLTTPVGAAPRAIRHTVGMRRISGLALTTTLLLAATGLSPSAQAAGLPIPVDCTRRVVLTWDGLTYDLQGTCGVVVIAADDTEVSIPAARKVVVRGEGNVVHAKPADRLRVLGRGQHIDVVSVRALRVASPGSVVTVTGLAEEASVAKRRARLTADRLSELVVEGHHHTVRVRRGTTVVRDDGRHNTIRVHRRG